MLFRAWAGRPEPLDLVGPAEALEVFRDWVGPDDPVRPVVVAAGDVLDLDGYVVRVLAAAHGDAMTGPGVLYDVTTPDGGRLLYATDTGPLPAQTVESVRGRAFDVVLLEESFGDRLDHGTDHLDLATFPLAVAALRAVGAVTGSTDVVAVHLGHRNPPLAQLQARLGAWGARAVPDGTRLLTGADDAQPARGGTSSPGRRTLVLGGARSGKSAWAEAQLAAEPAVTYVATSGERPGDKEWVDRVALHRARRPPGWTTVESTDLAALLRDAVSGQPLLVDCVSLWLAAAADEAGIWSCVHGTAGCADCTGAAAADAKMAATCDELVAAWRGTRARAFLVSNEVGSGVVPATASGRRYRDELGRRNARLAAESDSVVMLVAGRALALA